MNDLTDEGEHSNLPVKICGPEVIPNSKWIFLTKKIKRYLTTVIASKIIIKWMLIALSRITSK